MNLVERWFSALTTKKLQQSAHRSAKALASDIQPGSTPGMMPETIRVAKTTEQILDRLAGYCQSRHPGAS
jgi:hypothetical protein